MKGTLLEVSSGVGMHIEYFAPKFPNLTFQPSEYDARLLDSVKAFAQDCPTKNVCPPIQVDIRKPYTEWGENHDPSGPFLTGDSHKDFKEYKGSFDYMLNINLMHISEFECTEGLFYNTGQLLKPGGLLFTYGAYAENGIIEPESNRRFDAGLRNENAAWGLRDIVDLKKIALKHEIELVEKYEMPANNKTLIWKKL